MDIIKIVEQSKTLLKANKKKVILGGVSFFCLLTMINTINSCSLSNKQKKMQSYLDELNTRVNNLETTVWDLDSKIAVIAEKKYEQITKVVITNNSFDFKEYDMKDIYNKAYDYGKDSWETKAIASQAKKMSEKYDIPIHVIYTIIKTESNFKPSIDSKSGAKYGRGLMQVSEIALKEYNGYHKEKRYVPDLYNVEWNMEIGCWYYRHIYDKYAKEPEKSQLTWGDLYCAYNVGYSDFIKNKDSYRKGWDPTRKINYTALKHWNTNFKEVSNFFYA